MPSTADEIKLVLSRLEVMPSNLKMIVGAGYPTLTKDALIEHVKADDELGELIIKAHLLYLQSFKKAIRFEGQ